MKIQSNFNLYQNNQRQNTNFGKSQKGIGEFLADLARERRGLKAPLTQSEEAKLIDALNKLPQALQEAFSKIQKNSQ